MANLKDVIYLSNEDYDTLVSTGTVTIDGDTLTYDENNVYITPEVMASSTQDGLMSASDKIKLDGVDTTYLPLTGGEITGNVIVNGMHRDQYYASNVCRFFSNQTPTEYVIKTKIKYASGSYMPVIRIYGYAYGLQCPIELRVGFYIYSDTLGWSGAVSTGAWKPEVYLFRYTQDSENYVAVGFKGSCYYPGFQVDAQVGALGNFGTVFNPEGWSVISNGADTTVHLIPDVGVDKCVQVSYKTMKTDVEGYSTYIKDGTYSYTPTSIHTSLDGKLSTSGGTLSLANSDSLKIKRTASSAGAYVRYYNNNQDTNYWMAGMKETGSFMFNYNGTDKAFIDTAGTIHTVENVNAIRFRSNHNDYLTDVAYETSGNEALVFKSKSSVTSFIFANGVTSATASNEWISLTPGLQIKNNKVAISKLIANNVDPTYNLDVNGTANATTLYENGTTLSSKYGQLSAANTWTGVNTFNASDFYVTATNDVSISGNSGQNIISTDNGTDVIVGDTATDTTYIYGGVVDLNSSAVTVGSSSSGSVSINGATTVTGSISWASDPSNNNHLTRKSYVDNKFVDKTSNQTGIAGNKTWTGLSNFTSGLSASKSESNKAELHFSVDSERVNLSVYDVDQVYSDEDTGVFAGFYYSGTPNKKPGFDIYTQSYYSMYYAGVVSTNGESASLYSTDSDIYNTSSVMVKGRDIVLTSDHEGIGEVSTTFHNDGGIMYLGDPNSGWVSINDIIAQITCFRGDTTYVTMYDGTKKLISEVKEGDSVLGYDVNKKDYCEAIVIKNLKTGEQMGYNCYVMDDGTTIDIHGDDNFIANVKDKWYCDSDGDYLGIYSMTKNLMKFHDTGDDSHRIIKETGNLNNTTCVIHSFWTPCAEMTPRYSLYTSNGTMFVNGLLHAQSPRDTINIFRKRRFTLPDNIKEIFDEISVDMSARDEALPNDRISNPEKAENIAKLNEAKVKIAVYKKKLADTDYKAMKYAEGALTEEEWLPVKEDRASWRNTVNQMEEVVAEYQPIVEEENPEMFEHDWQYKNSKWKYRQSIFDAHLEDFREWQDSVKEERQKRIEESKERSRLRAEEIKANKSSQKNEDK